MSTMPERVHLARSIGGRLCDFGNEHDTEYVRADRIEELEAKLSESEALLAKAVEAIEFWSQALEPEIDAAINLMQATLAELKGTNQ